MIYYKNRFFYLLIGIMTFLFLLDNAAMDEVSNFPEGPGNISETWGANESVYEKNAERFEIEAEDFTGRDNSSLQGDWVLVNSQTNQIAEGENIEGCLPTLLGNASGNFYMEVIGQNAKGAPNSMAYDGPKLEYQVNILFPGHYHLFIRWAGRDGSTDSLYAMIINQDGEPPEGPEYFLYPGRSLDYYDGWTWDGTGLQNQTSCAYAGRPHEAEWKIKNPGIYTIILAAREQGTAVDCIVLQASNLPSKTEKTEENLNEFE